MCYFLSSACVLIRPQGLRPFRRAYALRCVLASACVPIRRAYAPSAGLTPLPQGSRPALWSGVPSGLRMRDVRILK